MEKTLKWITNGGTILVVLTIAVYFISPRLYKKAIQEDGPMEYLTAALLLILAVFLWIKVIKIGSQKSRVWLAFNSLMAGGLFFGFGEEISWGQRIFNLSTAPFFMENNIQKENNIHNLIVYNLKLNKWIFSYLFTLVFGLYFYVSAFAYTKIKRVKKTINTLGMPLPSGEHTIKFTLISLLILMLPDDKKWEVWECFFALSLLAIFINPLNKAEKLCVGRTRPQKKQKGENKII